MQVSSQGNIIALDVGDARIGVAVGHTIARLPSPIGVIHTQPIDEALAALQLTIRTQQEVVALVVGMPFNQDGNDTPQSKKVKEFIALLKTQTTLPIFTVDESFSSQEADSYIKQHKITSKHNDAIAACLVLQRFFDEQESAYA